MTITRLSDIAEKEYERVIRRLVEQKFDAIRGRTDVELPWIADPYYPEQHDILQRRVLQALRCRRWFESEAPPWAQPLPLSFDDCVARFHIPHRGSQRGWLTGEYGKLMRGMNWNYERAPPFEMHCAQLLVPSP
jgi:hypothetical protein